MKPLAHISCSLEAVRSGGKPLRYQMVGEEG